eukprot:tig00000147_g9455.t1
MSQQYTCHTASTCSSSSAVRSSPSQPATRVIDISTCKTLNANATHYVTYPTQGGTCTALPHLDDESQLVEEDFAAEAELDAAELDAAADLAKMVEAELLAADA